LTQPVPLSAGILGQEPQQDKSQTRPQWDDKLAAFQSAERANGLCMKCGEPYNPHHRCPKQVPLHVLEEVLDIFQMDHNSRPRSEADSQDSDEKVFTLSSWVVEGIKGRKSIKLQGLIHNQEILILVDSRSYSIFIKDTLVHNLNIPTVPIQSIQVTVADGNKLHTNTQVTKLQWWTQGHTFSTDAKVLPMGSYYLITGMDWLAEHNPMWIH